MVTEIMKHPVYRLKLHLSGQTSGFAYVWNNQALDNLIFHEIKQRLFDDVNQELIISMNTSIKLQAYCPFKEDTRSELYLDAVKPKYIFRLSSHSLAIETGWYTDYYWC